MAPLKLWGCSLPIERLTRNSASYQFWVVHLEGRKVGEYVNSATVIQKKEFDVFADSLVMFFENQFDAMRDDEKKNIKGALVQNCETLYIASFNTHKQLVPTIVAAVQYTSSSDGAFINWLGVMADIPDDVVPLGRIPIRIFRRLGLGMFLQNLIQFQLLARGFSPRLLLQCIENGDACEYYLHRGYSKASANRLQSVPGMLASPFPNHHLHFITDPMQTEEEVPSDQRLSLFYRDGFVITTFLDDNHNFFLGRSKYELLSRQEY
jgi:hypothetical protein